MVTTCLLSSMQLRLLLHFIPAMLQYATQSAPYHTTSSANHWMETLLSHFSVFSPGNFEGFVQRWNQAALKPLNCTKTTWKTLSSWSHRHCVGRECEKATIK